MLNEYNAEVIMSPMGHKIARWIDPEDLDEKMSSSRNILARDRFDQPLFLFENQFIRHGSKQNMRSCFCLAILIT